MNKEIFLMVVVFFVVAFGTFYAASYGKRFSYWMWYEDQVKQTVQEMIENHTHEAKQ